MSKTDDITAARGQVDEIDGKIIELLSKRFQITRQIGVYKAELGIEARDAKRERAQRDAISKKATELEVNPELAYRLLELVIEEAVKEHREIRARHKA
jgi:chorismate mutase